MHLVVSGRVKSGHDGGCVVGGEGEGRGVGLLKDPPSCLMRPSGPRATDGLTTPAWVDSASEGATNLQPCLE